MSRYHRPLPPPVHPDELAAQACFELHKHQPLGRPSFQADRAYDRLTPVQKRRFGAICEAQPNPYDR